MMYNDFKKKCFSWDEILISLCEFLIFILNDHCMKSNTDFMGPITMQLGQSNILTHDLT